MKRYDLMHLWEVYGGQLDVEYRQCLEEGLPVETGVFQAHMAVELINDGPVTIMLETPAKA